MWLRRLVGIVMIITCIGMNALVIIGFVAPDKNKQNALTQQKTLVLSEPAPTVTITAKPDAISAGDFSALTWQTTGNPDKCVANESWSGIKTQFGAESTGRINTPGNYNYTLTCSNKGGSAKATVVVAVGPANTAAPAAPKSNTGGSAKSETLTYCGGRNPCYGPHDVSTHSSSGNCWGWLSDKVINVSSFDTGFHNATSGSGSIQVGGVCGKDLMPAVSGSVSSASAGGHNHTLGAKSTSDANYQAYFVGYFDPSKP